METSTVMSSVGYQAARRGEAPAGFALLVGFQGFARLRAYRPARLPPVPCPQGAALSRGVEVGSGRPQSRTLTPVRRQPGGQPP